MQYIDGAKMLNVQLIFNIYLYIFPLSQWSQPMVMMQRRRPGELNRGGVEAHDERLSRARWNILVKWNIIIVMSLLTLIWLFMMKQWQWRLINSDGGDRQAGNLYGKPQSPRRLLCAVDKAKVNPRVVGTRRSNAEAETRLVLHNWEPAIDNWQLRTWAGFTINLSGKMGGKGTWDFLFSTCFFSRWMRGRVRIFGICERISQWEEGLPIWEDEW